MGVSVRSVSVESLSPAIASSIRWIVTFWVGPILLLSTHAKGGKHLIERIDRFMALSNVVGEKLVGERVSRDIEYFHCPGA